MQYDSRWNSIISSWVAVGVRMNRMNSFRYAYRPRAFSMMIILTRRNRHIINGTVTRGLIVLHFRVRVPRQYV